MEQKDTARGREAPPDLRRAAHDWRRTQKDMIGADGASSKKASEEHRRASRKLAAVVDYDMRTGGSEP